MKKEMVTKKPAVKKAAVRKVAVASVLELPVYDLDGSQKGTMTLPKEIFGAPVNKILLAQAVRVHRMRLMQGTSKAKTRGEVTGSGVKIYKQKGTGRARHGDRYAPIFVGGGIAFPPQPRNMNRSLSKPMKRLALISALSSKCKIGVITIVDSLTALKPKTAAAMMVFEKLHIGTKQGSLTEKVLLTIPTILKNISFASRNIAQLTLRNAQTLSTYDVLFAKKIIMTKEVVELLTKRLQNHE